MMRTCTTLLLFFALLPILPAQIDLPSEQWREDLRFLQKTVHDDYDFLFKKVTAETFDAEVEKLYTAIPEMADHEVIVGLARLVALFKYGHTAIGLTNWSGDNPAGFRQMPYNLYQFNDGVYVQGVHKDYRRALGARVVAVESSPVEKALAAVRPAFPDENDQFFKAYGLHYLGIPEVLHAQGITDALKKEITLTLEKDGDTFKTTFAPADTQSFPGRYGLIEESENWLDAREDGALPLWRQNLDRIYFYEYLNELDNYTNAIFVGEPTGENINFYGDNRQVELPNSKIPVRLSFAWWQDKPQWENGPWTPPHVAADLSFDDYRSNRDPVLAAVWNYDEDSPVVNPMEHLTALFTAGKLDEVKSEAARLVNDPRYRYYNFEEQFNRAGYNLLGGNQLQPAIFVFELNAGLFPESDNAWDSLAEAYWKAGDKDKAVQYYKKAIELDPEGSVGAHARSMLEQIKAEK